MQTFKIYNDDQTLRFRREIWRNTSLTAARTLLLDEIGETSIDRRTLNRMIERYGIDANGE